ncbi:MATE family efflux transporter [Celerinatantimonas yamalensis]|uniref:Multidrug-efflux transporter n=1 Tax=Celerinatantimonas yamalensis TaxID=559956 RepID=A0ABW9G3B0_9GAMM
MKSFIQNEAFRLVRLAFPVLITQLIMIGMSVVDTLMAGQVSATDLAAVALGGSLIMPLVFFCQGVLLAVTPIIANHFGAKRYRYIRRNMMQSLWLAFFLSLFGFAIATQLGRVAAMMSQDQHLIALASRYIHFMSFGIFGGCFYQAWRGLNEGMGNTRVIMMFGILGLLLNIPANYIFIHGLFGLPRLGGAGCGLATALVFTFMALGLGGYVYSCKRYRYLQLFQIQFWPRWDRIYAILCLGLPIAFSIFFEISLFSAITLLMTPFGPTTIAGHQVALNVVSVVFMVPLSIGITLTIRVGQLLGERRLVDARRVGLLGLGLCLIVAMFTASLTLIFRPNIVHFYSQDPQVQIVAIHLLLIGAAFQIFDALQVVTAGILRGYQDTRSVLWITLISYWPIGLGSGCILGLTDWLTKKPMGATGFWLAFMFGLGCSAILLLIRFSRLSRRYANWNIPSQKVQHAI